MAAALSLPHAAAPLVVLRASRFAPWAARAPRRRLLPGPPTAGEPPPPALPPASKLADPPVVGAPEPPLPFRAAEAEILRDVEPVVQLIKDILHSDRWALWKLKCGGRADFLITKLPVPEQIRRRRMPLPQGRKCRGGEAPHVPPTRAG
nr:unnamed protein product [Digitaria exilis]